MLGASVTVVSLVAVPEWLIGLLVGVAVTLIGTYYGDWLVKRRDRRAARRKVIEKAWALLVDAHPKRLDARWEHEALKREGDVLWERWLMIRSSLLELVAAERSQDVLEAAHSAASKIGAAIQEWRKGVGGLSAESRAAARLAVETLHDDAFRALSDLHDAFRKRRFTLR
jgi:hypothetical protein